MGIDGEKGMTFMFLKKVGDDNNKFYKVYGKETSKGKYTIIEKKGEKETTKEDVSEADVKKMLKANKDLKFVLDFMSKEKGTYGARRKRGSKKKYKKKSKRKSKKKSKKKSKRKSGGAKKKRKS